MKRIVLFFVLMLSFSVIAAEGSVRLFDTVHFKGLQTLTKYDIAKRSGMQSRDSKIAVDMERLEAVLSSESAVQDYSIIDKKNILTIVVTEYTPEYTVFITGRRTNIFCETDAEFNIIATRTLHTVKLPLIVIDVSSVDDKKISSELQIQIASVMKQLKESPLAEQVKQVDFSTSGLVAVTLKGRRTRFLLSQYAPELERLESAVGYLDSLDRYPGTLDVRGRMAVIR